MCCRTQIDYSNIRYQLREKTQYINLARITSTGSWMEMWFYKHVCASPRLAHNRRHVVRSSSGDKQRHVSAHEARVGTARKLVHTKRILLVYFYVDTWYEIENWVYFVPALWRMNSNQLNFMQHVAGTKFSRIHLIGITTSVTQGRGPRLLNAGGIWKLRFHSENTSNVFRPHYARRIL